MALIDESSSCSRAFGVVARCVASLLALTRLFPMDELADAGSLLPSLAQSGRSSRRPPSLTTILCKLAVLGCQHVFAVTIEARGV